MFWVVKSNKFFFHFSLRKQMYLSQIYIQPKIFLKKIRINLIIIDLLS